MEKNSINVQIAGTSLTMDVLATEKEDIQNTVREINNYYKDLASKYNAPKDTLLTIAILHFARIASKLDKKSLIEDDGITAKIEDIHLTLQEFFSSNK